MFQVYIESSVVLIVHGVYPCTCKYLIFHLLLNLTTLDVHCIKCYVSHWEYFKEMRIFNLKAKNICGTKRINERAKKIHFYSKAVRVVFLKKIKAFKVKSENKKET